MFLYTGALSPVSVFTPWYPKKLPQSYPRTKNYPGIGSRQPKNGLHRWNSTDKRVNLAVPGTELHTRECIIIEKR
jgi:hypothetical protein